jgi:hypothetical protein
MHRHVVAHRAVLDDISAIVTMPPQTRQAGETEEPEPAKFKVVAPIHVGRPVHCRIARRGDAPRVIGRLRRQKTCR